MQEEDLLKIEEHLSVQRLEKYGELHAEALSNYKWNIALSESLYPLLHTIEIVFRNKLHMEISRYLNDTRWLVNKNMAMYERMNGFYKKSLYDGSRNIKSALMKINKLDEGHFIAELNFGFWVSILGNNFEFEQFLWPPLKNSVFPNAHGQQFSSIRRRFNDIRDLRNRVFHYEPILNLKGISKRHDDVVEAISWIEPALINLLVDVDRFSAVFNNKDKFKV